MPFQYILFVHCSDLFALTSYVHMCMSHPLSISYGNNSWDLVYSMRHTVKVSFTFQASKQQPTYVCFLTWWYPQNTPKWSFLVGKPMVVGYQHFRKHPYDTIMHEHTHHFKFPSSLDVEKMTQQNTHKKSSMCTSFNLSCIRSPQKSSLLLSINNDLQGGKLIHRTVVHISKPRKVKGVFFMP